MAHRQAQPRTQGQVEGPGRQTQGIGGRTRTPGTGSCTLSLNPSNHLCGGHCSPTLQIKEESGRRAVTVGPVESEPSSSGQSRGPCSSVRNAGTGRCTCPLPSAWGATCGKEGGRELAVAINESRSLWTPDGRHLVSSSKPRSCQQVGLPKIGCGGTPTFIMPGGGQEAIPRLPCTAQAWLVSGKIKPSGRK